jgi:protein ImuB
VADQPERPARRVAAIVLPELLCELAVRTAGAAQQSPFGVVVAEHAPERDSIAATAVLDAVNSSARRFGVRRGQTLAEARALSARLSVYQLTRGLIEAALGRVAEAALAFGATVSVTLPAPAPAEAASPDTVWVDLSGSAHLFGGEPVVAAELTSLVRGMGHLARVAVAAGPRLAQALARWSVAARMPERERPIDSPEQLAALPVVALPLERQRASWLVRLGILTLADLAALPRSAAAARLGEHASLVLDLCAGRDSTPLIPYAPARVVVEQTSFDDPVAGLQPLRFVLHGLLFRISARLAGRGEAAQALLLELQHDRSIAELRQVDSTTRLRFELASPLWRNEELYRVIFSRLERIRLEAPTVAVRLEVPMVTRALARQLQLGRVASTLAPLQVQTLPVLIAELAADLGKQQVGVLKCVDSHRPEVRSRLVPLVGRTGRGRRLPGARQRPRHRLCLEYEPTRLFCQPVPIRTELRVGATCCIDHRLYTIARLTFERRLEATEWWSPAGVSRDYLRLWLEGPAGGMEAFVFIDRNSGARYLQGIVD